MSRFTTDEDLMYLPLAEALEIRWEQGRAEYRDSEDASFVGDAVVELHTEALDSMLYVAVIEKEGDVDPDVLYELRRCAYELVQGARLLAERKDGD